MSVGTIGWAGIMNSYYFVDAHAGVGGVDSCPAAPLRGSRDDDGAGSVRQAGVQVWQHSLILSRLYVNLSPVYRYGVLLGGEDTLNDAGGCSRQGQLAACQPRADSPCPHAPFTPPTTGTQKCHHLRSKVGPMTSRVCPG